MAKFGVADYVWFIGGAILMGCMIWIVSAPGSSPYKVGQVVCLPNGARGTVQNVTSYRTTVLTVDNLNRMYTIGVMHSDITECK